MQTSAPKTKAQKTRKEQREEAQRERERRQAAKDAAARGESAPPMASAQRRQQEAALQWGRHLAQAEECVAGKDAAAAVDRWAAWAAKGAQLAQELDRASDAPKSGGSARNLLWSLPLQKLTQRLSQSDISDKNIWEWACVPLSAFQKIIEEDRRLQGQIGAQASRRLVAETRSAAALREVSRAVAEGIPNATPRQFRDARDAWSRERDEALALAGRRAAETRTLFNEAALEWSMQARKAADRQSNDLLRASGGGMRIDCGAQLTPEQRQNIKNKARDLAKEWLALSEECVDSTIAKTAEEASLLYLASCLSQAGPSSDEPSAPLEGENAFAASRAKWQKKALEKLMAFGPAAAAGVFAMLDEQKAELLLDGVWRQPEGSKMAIHLARAVDWGKERQLNSRAHQNALSLLTRANLSPPSRNGRAEAIAETSLLRSVLLDALIANGAMPWKEARIVALLEMTPGNGPQLAASLRARQEGAKIGKVISATMSSRDSRAEGEAANASKPAQPAPRASRL